MRGLDLSMASHGTGLCQSCLHAGTHALALMIHLSQKLAETQSLAKLAQLKDAVHKWEARYQANPHIALWRPATLVRL